MIGRKSEILVIKFEPDKQIVKRITVKLPWNVLTDDAMGYLGNNVIYDISGAIYNLEKYKEALTTLKNKHDSLSGELLFNSHGKK